MARPEVVIERPRPEHQERFVRLRAHPPMMAQRPPTSARGPASATASTASAARTARGGFRAITTLLVECRAGACSGGFRAEFD
jgi:hypothetical protein